MNATDQLSNRLRLTRLVRERDGVVLRLALFLALTTFPISNRAASYSVQRWEASESSLPQNTVTAVVQTRDGHLWLGTYSGLARFDGVRFTVFDDSGTPGLASSRVTSLFEADDGTLWIGHEAGGLSRFRAGVFETVEIKANWSDGRVQELITDEVGDLWAVNSAGTLARVRDGLVLTPEAGAALNLVSVARSARGKIWVARNGRASALVAGTLAPLGFSEAANNTAVMGLAAAKDESLWVVGDGRLRKWSGSGWIEDRGAAPWNGAMLKLLETRGGALFAASSDQGCSLVLPNSGGTLQFNRSNGFPSDWVISLCEDREGNLWAGTGGGGLAVVRPASFQTIEPPDQWQGRVVLSVCASRDGSLWIGTEGAGLYRYQGGGWSTFAEGAGIQNPYVWSVAEDSRDGLWVGTWSGGLLLRREDFFDRVDGLRDGVPRIMAILCSPRGGLWVGTGDGLMRYEGGRATWYGRGEKPGQSDVRAVAESREGTVWFGMTGGGLGSLKPDGQFRRYRRADGLGSDYVGCLRLEDDGTLWVGTLGGGLTRWKAGKFQSITGKQGLPNGFICHIEDDGLGYYWMSTHGGVIRVNKAELNRCADGERSEVFCRTFGLADGLPTLKCSDGLQPAGCRTADGRLWFSTSRGLVTVNPRQVATNSLPPPVVIESLQLDDETVTFSGSTQAVVKIPPGRHRVEFRYTGLSFVASEKIRFKHRLSPLDKDWVAAGGARTATYNYMPPGDYVFEVIACNNDGVWSQNSTQVGFTVVPFFWQALWFRVAGGVVAVALAGGVVWFVTRRRLRGKLERLEREHAIENERARIAKDIHDDVGATLTRITMLSDPARGEVDEAQSLAAADIGQIHQTARELTRSMDEIVWAINPQHDTLDSLVSYLEKYAQDYLGTAGIRCRLDLPLQFPTVPLSAEMRHNLFLAYKEALNNVVKHSGATQVRITVSLAPTGFALSLEDDGHGFALSANGTAPAPDPLRYSGGNGLVNMSRRLERIGGQFELESSPGLGTRVKFIVPSRERTR